MFRRIAEATLHSLIRFAIHAMYRFEKTGRDAVPEHGPALLVCNHVSFVDALIIAAAFRRPVRFIMHHAIWRHPALNWIFRIGGVIPIAPRHEDPALTDAAFDRTAAALRRGELVCIFPEGKITWDGELNEFKSGVERIMAESNVPVIPMALRGLWGSFFSRRHGPAMSRWPRRFWSKIELRCGRRLSPQIDAHALGREVLRLRGAPC